MNTTLNRFKDIYQNDGKLAAAEFLAGHFRTHCLYAELFETRKILDRLRLGLTAVSRDNELLSPEQTDILERGLIDACREVGLGLLNAGKLQEGWMYMRAVGDKHAASEALSTHEITAENLDLYLSIFLQEGVNIGRGVQLLLEHRGTCNTITMLESIIAMRDRKDQQAGVTPLLRHVHAELFSNLQSDIQRRNQNRSSELVAITSDTPLGPIATLLASQPGMLRDGSYHLDTSHLSSTIRFARVMDDPNDWRLALDLARYGRELHSQYHYPGEEPFADIYVMSIYFFSALLGENTEASLRPFLQKAESIDPQEHGTVAIETYADLLSRMGRHRDALQFLMRKMPRGMRPVGIAPSLIELSALSKDFQPMLAQTEERDDLMGHAAAVLQSEKYQNTMDNS